MVFAVSGKDKRQRLCQYRDVTKKAAKRGRQNVHVSSAKAIENVVAFPAKGAVVNEGKTITFEDLFFYVTKEPDMYVSDIFDGKYSSGLYKTTVDYDAVAAKTSVGDADAGAAELYFVALQDSPRLGIMMNKFDHVSVKKMKGICGIEVTATGQNLAAIFSNDADACVCPIRSRITCKDSTSEVTLVYNYVSDAFKADELVSTGRGTMLASKACVALK